MTEERKPMIDKQKLKQWIEEKRDVYGPPYFEEEENKESKGVLTILNRLEIAIDAGFLDAIEEPKLHIDEQGNLTQE